MAKIAARVGGSKATLYNHFKSKEDLLLAVVEDVTGPAAPTDIGAGPDPSDFRAWLHWLGCRTAKRVSSPDFVSLQRLAASEAHRFPEIGRALWEAGVLPGFVTLTPIFEAAMDKGLLRRVEAQLAMEQFLELCTGWQLRGLVWNIRAAPTDEEIDANVGSAVAVFMDGYCV
jgi:AcrR family transcriptional regulator